MKPSDIKKILHNRFTDGHGNRYGSDPVIEEIISFLDEQEERHQKDMEDVKKALALVYKACAAEWKGEPQEWLDTFLN